MYPYLALQLLVMAGGERARPRSDQELIFEKRPSMCTSGILCRVLTNHISVHVNDKSDFSEIHQYDVSSLFLGSFRYIYILSCDVLFAITLVISHQVSIRPVTACCVNHAVIRELVNKHAEVGFQPDCSAYDGSKILYTLAELNFGSSVFKITLQDKEEDSPDGPRALRRYIYRSGNIAIIHYLVKSIIK
jgi:hypothetical protein